MIHNPVDKKCVRDWLHKLEFVFLKQNMLPNTIII